MSATMKINSRFVAREAYINSPMVEADPNITWKEAFAECRKNHPKATDTKFGRPGETIEGESTALNFDTLTFERELEIVNVEVSRALFAEACKELGRKATPRTVNQHVREKVYLEFPDLAGADRINLIKVGKIE